LQNAVKDVVYVYMPLLLLTYHTLYPVGYDHHISKMGHTIVVGLSIIRVRRHNPPFGLELPRVTRVRDEATQGMASGWHIRSPAEGTWHPQASYLSPEWEVFFMPLRVG
jgi:hypothetical protein